MIVPHLPGLKNSGKVLPFTMGKIGNSVSSTESDLFSRMLRPGHPLGGNGGWFDIEAMISILSTGGTNKVIRAYWGATKIYDSGILSPASTISYKLRLKGFAESSVIFQIQSELIGFSSGLSAGAIAYSRVTSIPAAANTTVKITGQSSGGSPASGDVSCLGDWASFVICQARQP